MAVRHDAQRRSIRLEGYDYSRPGAYFVTLCTHNRECLFGEIADDTMLLNSYGQIAEEEWLRSAEIRAEVEMDVFVVMPNHVHGIVWMKERGAVDAAQWAHGRAPTAASTKIARFIGRWLQVRRNQTRKRFTLLAGWTRLAAQLLRTDCQGRRRTGAHPSVHH